MLSPHVCRTMTEVVHMIAVRQVDCKYILGQFSKPFESAAAMIKHYSERPLRIRGAAHTILTHPVDCDEVNDQLQMKVYGSRIFLKFQYFLLVMFVQSLQCTKGIVIPFHEACVFVAIQSIWLEKILLLNPWHVGIAKEFVVATMLYVYSTVLMPLCNLF